MLSDSALLWTRICALGTLLIAANLAYALWKARRQDSWAAQWLIVPGAIIACAVTVPRVHTSDDETDCSFNVRYRYRVGGKEYEGSHIHVRRDALTTRLLAEETAARYPVGSRVDVHYRPDHPATAVLEPKDPGSRLALIVFLAIFAWELSLKVGDGGNRKGGISWGCLTPPLLHQRSDMPCPKITLSS